MPVKAPEISSVKRVGIWIRVSTEDQARGESPEHHEQRARYYAESKGWAVVDVYHLEGVSGKTVVEHAEAKRMLKDIERGHITGLIFSKLARLGRNIRELLDFSDFFDKHHADLISLQESIDTSTPAGRLFYTMIAAMAHWEREEIASRTAASVPIRAKLGKPLGGAAPYGYQWKDKKLAIHPDEAPIRKLAYELFAKHQRRTTVAKMLNEMGYRGRQGRPFGRMTIECMIQDPTAKGVRRANYSKRVGGTKGWDFKPQSEWVFSECEPIVSEEIWDRCNAILAQQKTKDTPPAKRAVQLFGGLTWCGLCGSKMYVKSNTPKYVCRGCNNKVAVVDLEDIFVEQLKDYLLSPTEIAGYLEQADQTIRDKTDLLPVLEKERVTVQQEMDHIFKLYMDKKITTDEFGERYGPCEKRKVQLKEEIPQLEAEIDYLKVNLLSSDEILHQASDLYGRWSDLSTEDKHRVVQSIVERITIGKDEVEIQLYYLPTHQDPLTDTPSDPTNEPEAGTSSGAARYTSPLKSIHQGSFKDMANGASEGSLALPFCHLTLTGKKPMVLAPSVEVQSFQGIDLGSLGPLIAHTRTERGQTLRDASHALGICHQTLYKWEHGIQLPHLQLYPRIVAYLGYDPWADASLSFGSRLRLARLRLGLSRERMAEQLGISWSAYERWEDDVITQHHVKERRILMAFLRNGNLEVSTRG